MRPTASSTGSSRAAWIALASAFAAGVAFAWPAFLNGYPVPFNDGGICIEGPPEDAPAGDPA